ncbi:uncharacterized protein LOC141714729 [Apium graveolens]|uniref:uncharacterized protein LOC141714729 n=1 Tax=Apium graveolens TaxID=4045 RepID=UPI003D7BD062
MCQWCRKNQETDSHVLFEFQIATQVWNDVGLQGIITILPDENIFDIIRRPFERGSKEQCTLLAFALNLLGEWKKAQEQQLNPGDDIGGTIGVKKWVKPPDSWVKVNIDAATFESSGCIGLGSVVRGNAGNFLMAMSKKHQVLLPPREAEALCLKETLLWLKEKSYRRCIFETDSQVLVRACKGVEGRSFFHTIVTDCIDLFQHFEEVSVCFTHRSANGVAHALARAASSMSDYQEWHVNAPAFIRNVICLEAL